MKGKKLGLLLSRYGIVGIAAASIHGIIFIAMSRVAPLWLSNLCGFFSASFASYLGHALFTFREATKGTPFARRWLILQFTVNLIVSAALPLCLTPWASNLFITPILVFTPTCINALIWSKASKFSMNQQEGIKSIPVLHADDLGMTLSTNQAILSLQRDGKLDSASLLINGHAVESAIRDWESQNCFPLCLHLCLTEGIALSDKTDVASITDHIGLLNKSFGELLFISLLPKHHSYRKAIKNELRHELIKQINRFRDMTKLTEIAIDGHQHVHLIPIVLDTIIELSYDCPINWIRTTAEPFPTNIPLHYWLKVFTQGGWIKWMLLQLLTLLAKPKLQKASLRTNSRFAGILFTGRMTGPIITSFWKELRIINSTSNETPPLILSHPGLDLLDTDQSLAASSFYVSKKFIKSNWRKKEYDALGKLTIRNLQPYS